ncbi:polyisoprenoid diphosphate/phosphate phosphohydrolase PLPP6 [Sitodiplosis mosellana]|uniref:polyisoprenoid diphosphate/phosphate phosphohydrolase PLPP6 n=1 Tax=Sitodiplosis mosellana TaxID=263140 RepID=UPI00244480FA|nr:polyisoprenoid diphosphate/phosphate phosphohydrolase PLPP6 [Sitodiplosis mosellana]
MEGRSKKDEFEKRDIPPVLEKLLALDVEWTKRFVSFSLNFVPIRSLKTHCKFLEYSCHGLVWLSALLAICWLIDNPNYYQTQMNLFVGLILDIFFVAGIKAATRRRRPTIDDSFLTIGPDKFSFPSGHASRAFFILCFFTALDPMPLLFWPPLFAWATSVALSRLLLYRHHILDVLAGITLGTLEAFLICILWMGKDTSAWVMSWLSDEKLPSGSTQEDLF